MIDFKEKSDSDSLNQSESDDGFWLDNKIKEQLAQSSDGEQGASEFSHHSSRQEESFKGFEHVFFTSAPNFNSLYDNQPALPPGLGAVDKGFTREPFHFSKEIVQPMPFLVASEPLDTFPFPKFPQKDKSRYAHLEPESNKAIHSKSRLKLQSAQFEPDNNAEGDNHAELENIEENQENKIQSKEILDSPPEPEDEGNKEVKQPETKNPYEGSILSKREIDERKRKKAAEAEAAAQKLKAYEVIVVQTKPTPTHIGDETPNHEHKSEKSEVVNEMKHSKNSMETPKNQKGWNNENKMAKSGHIKPEPHVKPHFQETNPPKYSMKKDDSFKQNNTKHQKRGSFHQEPEIIEKKSIFDHITSYKFLNRSCSSSKRRN